MSVYFDDPIHRTLQAPYYQVEHHENTAWFLFFTKDWAFTHALTPDERGLLITLLDTETGKIAVDRNGYCNCQSKKEVLPGLAIFDG